MLEAKFAAAEAGRGCNHQHQPERSVGPCHEIGKRKDGDEQHSGAEGGPIAPAERGRGEGVGKADQRTDQTRERYELKVLIGCVGKAGLRQLGCDDAPDQPDRKTEMLGGDRPDEIAEGDVFTCRLPELLILWAPVRNPGRVPFAHQHFPLWVGVGAPLR